MTLFCYPMVLILSSSLEVWSLMILSNVGVFINILTN